MKLLIFTIIIFFYLGFSQTKKTKLDCTTNPGTMSGIQSNSQILMKGQVTCRYGDVLLKSKEIIWNRLKEELFAKDSIEISIDNFLLKGQSGHFAQRIGKFINTKGIAYEKIDTINDITNILEADSMFLFFINKTIEHIILKKQAKINYHLFNNKNEYIGKSVSQGDSIYIKFLNKKMQNLQIYNHVKGSFTESALTQIQPINNSKNK